MHHTSMHFKFASVSDTDRFVECTASSEAIDSYGEIVDQKSLKLDRYRANPVILFAHDSRSLPIGMATDVAVKEGALRAKIHFADTPRANECLALVRQKMLRGVSIGFVPGRTVQEKRHGKDVTVLYDGEIHELSIVPIPANQDALIRMKAAGIVESLLVTTAEEMDRTLRHVTADEARVLRDLETSTTTVRGYEGRRAPPLPIDELGLLLASKGGA